MGFYGRVFPPQKGLLNLETVVVTPRLKIVGLGHCSLRSPLVGASLLRLPHIIESELGISTETFGAIPSMVLVLFVDGSKPLVVDYLRDYEGKLHPAIRRRFDFLTKKSPTSEVEAGGNNIEIDYGYSANMSL